MTPYLCEQLIVNFRDILLAENALYYFISKS